MPEPGLDRHDGRPSGRARAALEDSPVEALPELDDLVERMLVEAGYPTDTPDPVDDEGIDPEVSRPFVPRTRSRGTSTAARRRPGDSRRRSTLYREIYEHLYRWTQLRSTPIRCTRRALGLRLPL